MQAFALNERPSESRVPGDAGQLFLAGFPLGAGEEARGDVDEAGDQLEYGGGGPGTAVAGAILADVQSVRHAGERNILNNHLGQKLESLYFQGIVFQVAAVGGDAKAEGDFLGGGGNCRLFAETRDFHFALPFQSDQAPAGVVHLRKVDGSRQDSHLFTHAIDLFHGSLPNARSMEMRRAQIPTGSEAILMPPARGAEHTESKRLVAKMGGRDTW